MPKLNYLARDYDNRAGESVLDTALAPGLGQRRRQAQGGPDRDRGRLRGRQRYAQGQWTAAVGQWLQAQYPATKLTVINSPIEGGFRGSGLSVFRLGHDVLSHRPDLLIVDFAADDFESNEDAVQANAEGMVRQAWKSNPNMDVLFVYAFRLEYEADYAKGLCPSTVGAYERVAARYGVPAINMGQRLAQLARDGKLALKASEAESPAKPDQAVFTKDGVYVSPAGVQLYGTSPGSSSSPQSCFSGRSLLSRSFTPAA